MFTLVAVATSFAQSAPKPAVVISIAPVKEQQRDINYMVEASGFGTLKFFIKSQIKYFTGGMDTTKPAGALMYFSGDNPEPKTVFFLPVKDIDDMLDTVSNFADVDDEDDVIQITPTTGGDTIYAREQGALVFLSNTEENLGELPEDPQSMLGDMPSKYNLAAHVYGSRVPEELRQKAIDMIKDGYIESLHNMGGDPDQIDSQIADFEEQIKVLSEIDELVVGMLADEKAHKMAMEFTVTGMPGSKIAKSYNQFAKADPTRFGGFMSDDAAFDFIMCFNVNAEDSEQVGRQLDGALESVMTELDNDGDFDQQEMETIRGALAQIADVVEGTVKNGRIDAGGKLMMGGNDFNFVAGGEVSDPKKVESAAKDILGLVKENNGDAISVNFDFAKVDGINMHEVVVKIADDEEELQSFVGSELVILLGIGEKDLYLAAGKSPMDALKAALKASNKAPEYPVIYNVRITPILEYVASVTGEPMADGFFEKLSEIGRDKMTVYSKAVENGLFTRMEMEDGPLALIQGAIQGFQEQMGGGADF